MRANRAERAATLLFVRPPIPRAIRIGARIRSESECSMPHFTDRALMNQLAHFDATRKKAQLVIDQCEGASFSRTLHHSFRFIRIHGHRLFAKHGLAAMECRQNHLAMVYDRRHDANQVNIVTRHDCAPIALNMGNVEFPRDFFSMFATGAGNRDNLRAFTVLETGNLRRLRKTGADYADSDGFLVRHFLLERRVSNREVCRNPCGQK